MHKALGSYSGWAKWGNRRFLGFGWWFSIFLRSCCICCLYLLSPATLAVSDCQPPFRQSSMWQHSAVSCSWKSAQTNKIKDESNSADFPQKKPKKPTVPQVHHPVDWQWQTSRRSNHWYKCTPEACLTRWTFLLVSLWACPLPKLECFREKQNVKEIIDPFLPLHLLLKHTSEREVQLRSISSLSAEIYSTDHLSRARLFQRDLLCMLVWIIS